MSANDCVLDELVKLSDGNVRGALVIFSHDWEYEKNTMPVVNARYYSLDDLEDIRKVRELKSFCLDSSWNHVYVIFNNEVVFYRSKDTILKKSPELVK